MIKSKEDELWEGQWEEEQEKRATRNEALAELRNEIHEYADDDTEYGWLLLHHEGRNYRFPKRAFIWYIFGNMTPLHDILPEYEAFSPSGLKLQMDNRYHSDVWLGAGFHIDDTYDHGSPQHGAFYEAERMIEKEMREIVQFDFTILANGLSDKSRISCMVYDHTPKENPRSKTNYHIEDAEPPKDKWDRLRAICIPNASIEYDLVARNADVIITEVGGELAHLAIVSREKGKVLIRVDNACKKFPYFSKLRIDFEDLTLKCE